jgi:hypothetical protein
MNILRYYFFVAILLVWLPLPLMAPVPDTVQFTVIFDYDKDPVHGTQNVVVRLYNSGKEVYKESVSNVPFNLGAGLVVIGGEGTNLLNSYFDDDTPEDPFVMEVEFSVKQHHIRFPFSSVPYTIRAKESNKARRLDGEHIMKFLEPEQRVGINNENPEVTLDINGGLRIDRQDGTADGTLHWELTDSRGQFYVYVDGGTKKELTYVISAEYFSKWEWDSLLENYLISNRSVGIGHQGMAGFSLVVSPNMKVSGGVEIGGDLYLDRFLKLKTDNLGFDTNGDLSVKSIELNSFNKWDANGDFSFSGQLFGLAHATDLTNLQHFYSAVFKTKHFSMGGPIISSNHLDVSDLSNDYIKDGSLAKEDLKDLDDITANAIAFSSITSKNIIDHSIQNHHVIRTVFSSSNAHIFNSNIISSNAIHGEHIKDGSLTATLLRNQTVLSEHVVTHSINSIHIQEYSLTADHVSPNSIPYSAIKVFSKEQGGTGKIALDSDGILFINSNQEYISSPNMLKLKHDRLMIGGGLNAPEAKVHLVGNSPQLEVYAKDDEVSNVSFLSPQSTWNMSVNAGGDFVLSENNNDFFLISGPSNSICGVGCIGIGVSNPKEQLVVSGGILLMSEGDVNSLPGTMGYGNSIILRYKNKAPSVLSMSSLKYRMYASVYSEDVDRSSVIFTDTSDLFGDHLFVNGVVDSIVHGQSLYSDHVVGSQLYGVDSKAVFYEQSYGALDQSGAMFVTHSDVHASQSQVGLVSDSQLDVHRSSVVFVQESSLNAMGAQIQYAHKLQGHLEHSNVGFSSRMQVDVQDSVVQHVNDASIIGKQTFLSDIDNATVRANGSRIEYMSNVLINVNDSWVQHVSDSTIMGKDIMVMGGSGHRISGAQHVSLNGDHHDLSGMGSVAIGDHLQSKHDNTVLLNASSQGLKSDHHGQIKLQADGNVVLQFSPDMAVSMVDSMGGWAHVSDKNIKTVLANVSRVSILNKMRQLPIQYWAYKTQFNVRHLGPTAQDFSRLFKYGNSDKVIHSIDSDGVLLASVQALHQQFNDMLTDLDTHSDQYDLDVSRSYVYEVALTDMSGRIAALDLKLKQYTHVMGQLSEDYGAQRHLMAYLVRQMQYYEIGMFLEDVFHPILLFVLLCFSVVFGGLIYVIYRWGARR